MQVLSCLLVVNMYLLSVKINISSSIMVAQSFNSLLYVIITAHKMKFSIKDFFSECDQIRSFLRIWSHLLKQSLMENFIFCDVYISTNCISITSILTFQVLLKSGHIEINPGPKKPSAIKFCHWNLNELAVHNFVKVPSIKAFITAHSIDIVCLSEVVLDSTIPHSDENININGYSLLRVDHPNNIK